MQISFSHALENGRAGVAIGHITATTIWRAADQPIAELDREAALRKLVREAEDYGADALVDVGFSYEETPAPDIAGIALRRITASGTAIRFAIAA